MLTEAEKSRLARLSALISVSIQTQEPDIPRDMLSGHVAAAFIGVLIGMRLYQRDSTSGDEWIHVLENYTTAMAPEEAEVLIKRAIDFLNA